jgi:hypothetical protein
MIYYRISDPSDLRELSAQHAAWVAAGNPKAEEWALRPPMPTHDPATQHAPEWGAGEWVARDLTADELAARARKVWPSAQDFWLEFSPDEMAAIATGTDAHLATLRTTLAMWRGEVWGDDERVAMGLGLLQQLGILTPERAATISAK